MCLLFFNINDECSKDELRLVLVNNRDEIWDRTTKRADFWTTNRSCISGLDQEAGKEGGTWFGTNLQGRIGCLVNIPAQHDPTKRGRGFLVTDFLTKPESIKSYADRVGSERDEYNGFILTLIQLGQRNSRVIRVTNDSRTDTHTLSKCPSPQDYFSVGNSSVNFPWRKVTEGGNRFQQIVQTHRNVSTKDTLKEELFRFMADTTRYLPDPHLQETYQMTGWPEESVNARSSVFVFDPVHRYGTRTTTLLLIDGEGNCEYTERTVQMPIKMEDRQWSSVQYHYKLQFDEAPCDDSTT